MGSSLEMLAEVRGCRLTSSNVDLASGRFRTNPQLICDIRVQQGKRQKVCRHGCFRARPSFNSSGFCMSQRPTLDASTFEGLLAAVWVLQRQHEQEARDHRPSPNAMLPGPRETHVEPHRVSERDTVNARLVLSVLGKAANRVQVPMRVRCENCDTESDARDRFCGMCGARLLEPQTTPLAEQPAESNPGREQIPPDGCSSLFPGPADEPDRNVAYLLEDEVSTSHWGRTLVLVVLLGCVAAAWNWRRDLRSWVARVSQRPAAPAVSSARPPTGTRTTGSNGSELVSGTARAVSRANPPAVLSAVDAPQGASLHNSESQTTREKTSTKPSAFIPFDSVASAARHHLRSLSGARRAADTKMPERNRHENASGAVEAGAVARAGGYTATSPAASSPVDAPRGASLHNSESPKTSDAQNAMDHKTQSVADGMSEKTATQPSAATHSDTVANGTRHYVPRPPPGFRASNIAAMAGHRVPRPPSEGGQATSESRSTRRQIAMSRVPRPPRNSTTKPWVPRPPARRVPRVIPEFDLLTRQVR